MPVTVLAKLAFVPVGYGPPRGPNDPASINQAKALFTGPLTWPNAGGFLLDPTQSNQLLELQNIQGVYVDNSQNPAAVQITVSGTGQVIVIPAQSQGWVTVIASDRSQYTITSAGASGFTQCWFVNFPISAMQWPAAAPGVSGAGNMQTQPNLLYSGGVIHPQVVPNLIYAGGGATTPGNTIQGAPGYFVGDVYVQPASNSNMAAAGNFGVTIADSVTGPLALFNFSIPASGLQQNPQLAQRLNWNSKTAGSYLTITFNSPLTAGSCVITFTYAIVSFLG